jgi:glycosyltransferase involved in cell wall biosynthesis
VKVVILHQHFKDPETGGAIRSYYLAKALIDRNIPVLVIAGHNKKEYEKRFVDGIEVHFLPIPYDNAFGFIKRSLSFLRYVWKSVALMDQFRGTTICYAISVPLTVGLAAVRIKRKYNIPYIFEVGDLWPDAPIQMGYVQNYFFKEFLYSLEKNIYRNAQKVVALSPAIQEVIEDKIPGKNVGLVPNMADCDYYKPEIKDSGLIAKYEVEGKFVVSYIGAIGAANGLDYFLECANTSRKLNPNIHFILCGGGALRERLQRNVEKLGLRNLTFVDFQNRDGVRNILNITDAVFVCYKNVPILETGSPNKFFDGLAAGKLIVINFGGWIRKEIEENNCGIYVNPRDPVDFVRRIDPFISDREKLQRYQQAARELAERCYSRKMLSERFVKLFV